jgi:type I restriction enzyme, S subunit
VTWPLVQLTPTLANVVRGVTYSQADASSTPVIDDIPVLRAGNIQKKLVTDKDLIWISKSFISDQQYLQKNDIVVCTSSGSGSLVGKSAILTEDFKGTWGAFNAVIRCNPEILNPKYLAYWLSSEVFRAWKDRQVQGANIQNIRQSALEGIRLPLPTLPEQQRIVEILQQLRAVATAKESINEQINLLVRTAYWQYFGDFYTTDGLINPVRISDYVDDSQYGVSEAMEETGSHAVLRMNSITTTGWLDLTDLKYASFSKKEIEATTLLNGDLLFNRTNSRELVGKCAIWRPTEGNFSFASYLVRLRLRDGMIPEYLWATLNSAYGKYRLFNSAKQAVSMANVSPTDLGRITVPLPPQPLQEKFAKLIKFIEKLRSQMLGQLDTYAELQTIVAQQALIGDLTTKWRDVHAKEIAQAAIERDQLLRERGAKIDLKGTAKTTTTSQAELTVRPARHWLVSQLSEFQRQLLAAFIKYCQQTGQPLLAEDPDIFSGFCDDELVTQHLQVFGTSLNNRIRRTLSQLAALGLIAKITLPKQNIDTGEQEYLKAFRPLRESELTRLMDMNSIRQSFEISGAMNTIEG